MDNLEKQRLKEEKYEAKLDAMARDAWPDLVVTDVRKISRSDALEIARSHGKDWQKISSFKQKDHNGRHSGFKSVQNAGAIDLIEIFYATKTGEHSGSVMIGYDYNRDLAGYYDLNVGDVITIFHQKQRPVCVFNHATNLITSCFDVKHIELHPNTGVDVKGRTQKVMQDVEKTVHHLRAKGQLTDSGMTPRAKSDNIGYLYKPKSGYYYLVWGAVGVFACLQIYSLYTQYNAFLVTFGLALVIVFGYYIYSNRRGKV